MKKWIPQNYYFVSLPMYFKYSSPSEIESIVAKNALTIMSANYNKLQFSIACTIFNYQNKINSVRAVIAIYF